MSSTISSTSANSAAASAVISSQGIGSGLDIASIVSSLTTAQAAPETNAINRSNATLNAQVSAWSTFNSAVSTFQATLAALKDPTQLAGRTATVSDSTVANATATSTAVPGTYTLDVNSLATAATLTSGAATATATYGTGTLTIAVNGVKDNIGIDGTNNTLAGIATAINNSAGNPGVTASVLTTTDGARLVLTGNTTGAANAILVTQTGDGGLAPLVYDPANNDETLTLKPPAADASFDVNGYPASSSSNQVTSVISGLTINLSKTTVANSPVTLTVGNDTAGAQTSISTFVTALNGLLSTTQSLTSYDPTTGTAGPLLGNSTVQAFKNQLSHILGTVNGSITSGPNSLASLGIGATTTGVYSTNSATVSNALTGNLSAVTQLLSGPNGIATQLDNFVNGYSQAGGLLDTVSNSLKTSLSNNAAQLTALNARMATYSATLTAEYNAMDTAVALLKQTQTYLSQQFNSGSSSSSTSSSSSLGSGTVSTSSG